MVSMLDEADEAPAGGADEDWVETHSSTHPSASTLSAGGAGGAHGSDDIPEIPDLDPDAAADSDSAAAAAGGRHSAVPDEPSLAALTLDDQSAHAVAGGDDDVPDMDDIPDMDDDGTDGFGGGLMDDEEDAATARAPPAAGGATAAGEDDGNLLAVRTYDVMITSVLVPSRLSYPLRRADARLSPCLFGLAQVRQVLPDAAGLAAGLLARAGAADPGRDV